MRTWLFLMGAVWLSGCTRFRNPTAFCTASSLSKESETCRMPLDSRTICATPEGKGQGERRTDESKGRISELAVK